MFISLFIVVGLLLLSGLFSASELAIMGTPLYKIKQLVKEEKKFGELLLKLRKQSNKTLVAILVGNNFVNVLLSVYASNLGDTILSQFAFGGAIALMIISFVTTFLILLFGEILPKAIATRMSVQSAQILGPVINICIYLLYPIVYILSGLLKGLNSIMGVNNKGVSRKDVKIFVEEGQKQGIFNDTESEIIDSLLDFKFRDVKLVSRHRTEMFAVSRELTLKQAFEQVMDHHFSRVPVYKDNKDNVIGLLTIRKLAKWMRNKQNWDKKLKDFDFIDNFKIPLTANLFDVFLKMKKMGYHFAIVVDEYGGTYGFVTLEDILEELVGDIKDETDINEEKEIQKVGNSSLVVKGSVLLKEVCDELEISNFKIPDKYKNLINKNDMVSSVILKLLSRFAKQGEVVQLDILNLKVQKMSANKKQILKVKVTKKTDK